MNFKPFSLTYLLGHIVNAFGISDYICPTSTNFKLRGNVYAQTHEYVQLNIYKWNNATKPANVTCQSDSDIDNSISDVSLDIALANSYFDFDDYDSPIKTYLDDRYKFPLTPDFRKSVTVYVKDNEVELKDNIFQYSPDGDEKKFVSVERVDQSFSNYNVNNSLLMSVTFIKDYNYDAYERKVFTLLEVFGNLGGLFEVLGIVGGILVGSSAERFFNYSIISHLYQVDPLPVNENALNNSLYENSGTDKVHEHHDKINANTDKVLIEESKATPSENF